MAEKAESSQVKEQSRALPLWGPRCPCWAAWPPPGPRWEAGGAGRNAGLHTYQHAPLMRTLLVVTPRCKMRDVWVAVEPSRWWPERWGPSACWPEELWSSGRLPSELVNTLVRELGLRSPVLKRCHEPTDSVLTLSSVSGPWGLLSTWWFLLGRSFRLTGEGTLLRAPDPMRLGAVWDWMSDLEVGRAM